MFPRWIRPRNEYSGRSWSGALGLYGYENASLLPRVETCERSRASGGSSASASVNLAVSILQTYYDDINENRRVHQTHKSISLKVSCHLCGITELHCDRNQDDQRMYASTFSSSPRDGDRCEEWMTRHMTEALRRDVSKLPDRDSRRYVQVQAKNSQGRHHHEVIQGLLSPVTPER